MKKLTIILCTIGALTFASCAFDPNAGAGGNAATFWNSPKTQEALSTLEDKAFSILTGLLGGLGGARASSPSVQDRAFDKLKATNPNVPDAVLRGAVAQAAKRL